MIRMIRARLAETLRAAAQFVPRDGGIIREQRARATIWLAIKQLSSRCGDAGRDAYRIFCVASLLMCTFLSVTCRAQITTTTIQDTIYNADGSVASGTVLVSWTSFSTAANGTVAAGNLTATIWHPASGRCNPVGA